MEFNEKLKELRIKNNISQSGLAKEIYVSRSAIAKWENGLGMPSDDNLLAIEKYFHISHDYFFSSEELREEYLKRIKRKNIIINTSIISVVIILLFLTVFWLESTKFCLKNGDRITVGNETYIIYKNNNMFEGTCSLESSFKNDVKTLDSITVWKGIFPNKYKVKYIAKGNFSGKSITVPRYFEYFTISAGRIIASKYEPCEDDRTHFYGENNEDVKYFFKKITVSKHHPRYDSREDCGCMIETKTNKLILASEESFIPSTVTEIGIDALSDFFRNKHEFTLPSNVSIVNDFAFGSDYFLVPSTRLGSKKDYVLSYFDFGEAKIIGGDVFYHTCYDNNATIILPNTLERISFHAFDQASIVIAREFESVKINLFYEGSKSEFLNIDIYNRDKCNISLYEPIDTLENFHMDPYINLYYYSECEPVEKNIYWHYDENNKPTIWI